MQGVFKKRCVSKVFEAAGRMAILGLEPTVFALVLFGVCVMPVCLIMIMEENDGCLCPCLRSLGGAAANDEEARKLKEAWAKKLKKAE